MMWIRDFNSFLYKITQPALQWWGKLAEKNKEYLVLSVISILVLFAYAGFVHNGLLLNWDDQEYILHNELIIDLSYRSIAKIFSSYFLDNYHPLTTLTNAMEYLVFGLNPFVYHFDNIIIHILNSFLVFYLIRKMGMNIIPAAFISLVFAIHPMHVESVVWASERKDVLYTFFYLSALMFYVDYVKIKTSFSNYALVFLFFILSLLSKSAAVSLPIMLLVFDWYLGRKITYKLLTEKILFFSFSIIFGLIAIDTQQGAMQIVPKFPPIDRIFLTAYAFQFYLVKFFLPFNLSTFHPYPSKINGFLPPQFYIASLSIFILIFIIWMLRKKDKNILFGAAFYTVSILLVLQIIPIGRTIVSERFSYVPYIGILILLMGVGNTLNFKIRMIFKVLASLYLILLLFLCIQRVAVWKDGYTLFSDVIEKYPQSAYAYSTRAYVNFVSNNYDPALIDCLKAIELDLSDDDMYIKVGMIKLNTGHQEEAKQAFNRAIQINRKNWYAYDNLGLIYQREGKQQMALDNYNISLQIHPDFVDGYANRGTLRYEMGDFQGAIKDFLIMKKFVPSDASLMHRLAKSYEALNDLPAAITSMSEGIKWNPNNPEYYLQRGLYYSKMEKWNEAVTDYTEAVLLKKDFAQALFQRALAKKSLNRVSEACQDLGRAAAFGFAPAKNLYLQNCR